MRGLFVLALFVAVAAVASTASCSPLATRPVATDNGPLVIAIGTSHLLDDDVNYVTLVDITSPSSNSHRNGTSPPIVISNEFRGALGPNNTIYIVGAKNERDYKSRRSSFMSYDVPADKWTTLPPFTLTEYTDAMVVVVVGTRLLAMGTNFDGISSAAGYDDGLGVYAFDLSSRSDRTWVRLPTPLPDGEYEPTCAVVNNMSNTVYYLARSGELFRSSDGAKTWTQLKSMPARRAYVGCAALDDVIVVAGGINYGTDGTSAAVYDIAKDEWRETQPMSKERDDARAVVVPADGGKLQVVVCGGEDYKTALSYTDCEQLDLSTNKWIPAAFKLGAQFGQSWFELFVANQN